MWILFAVVYALVADDFDVCYNFAFKVLMWDGFLYHIVFSNEPTFHLKIGK